MSELKYQNNPFSMEKEASIDRVSLITDINKRLVNLAFYPEFENKFPGADGRSKQDKIDRGGLTKKEFDDYKALNDLLIQYKDFPYELSDAAKNNPRRAKEEIRNLNANSVVYHLLYDLEKKLNSNPKATLRDVVDSKVYTEHVPKLKYKVVQKDIQNKISNAENEQRQQEEEKEQGYVIPITEKTRGQFDALKKYNPEWWETVERACKTRKLVYVDTGEVVSVRNEMDIWRKINEHNKPNTPFREALKAKFEAEAPQKLWVQVHENGETAFDHPLERSQVAWINKIPNAAYHTKTFQISPISLAAIKHASELERWKNDKGVPTKKSLTDKLEQWLIWVEEANDEIRSHEIPNFFVRYIDLSDKNGTWYKNTYRKIKAGIENQNFKSVSHLREYIYNSVLASVGQATLLDISNNIYKYLNDKPTIAMSEYDRVITALVA